MTGEKKISLLRTFTVMFLIFVIVTITVSAFATFSLQTNLYYNQYRDLLEKVNRNLIDEIDEDLESFADLQLYFIDHKDELKIPYDYPSNAEDWYRQFRIAYRDAYGSKVFGVDVKFRDLNDEVKRLYARYAYLFWLNTFDRMRLDYGLEYAYYVFPTDREDEMCFMFDGPREMVEVDGEQLLLIGYEAHQDRSIHKNLWKACETGKPTGAMDVYDNEYGHVYTYASPILYEGGTLGVIVTDVSYNFVNGRIRRTVFGIVGIFVVVLGLCSAAMMLFIRKKILVRLENLEGYVTEYAENKNPGLAGTIAENIRVNDEIGSLAAGFSGMITELHEYMVNLKAVTAEKERIGAELSVATDIQASMLPRIFPPFPDRKEFSLFASMDPAKEVGGDFYDFFMVDDNHIALVMADVSGKGVPAALFMAISKVLIKDAAQELMNDPAECLARVNNQLCEANDAELFVTVWLGIVEITTGKTIYADAGHEYPVLLHADGQQELVKEGRKNPPVATIEGLRYRNHELQLSVGDTLFLYTDGVPEATDSKEELYGMDRLQKVLEGKQNTDVTALLPMVRADVDAFVGDAMQFDDLTMLAFRLEEL